MSEPALGDFCTDPSPDTCPKQKRLFRRAPFVIDRLALVDRKGAVGDQVHGDKIYEDRDQECYDG